MMHLRHHTEAARKVAEAALTHPYGYEGAYADEIQKLAKEEGHKAKLPADALDSGVSVIENLILKHLKDDITSKELAGKINYSVESVSKAMDALVRRGLATRRGMIGRACMWGVSAKTESINMAHRMTPLQSQVFDQLEEPSTVAEIARTLGGDKNHIRQMLNSMRKRGYARVISTTGHGRFSVKVWAKA